MKIPRKINPDNLKDTLVEIRFSSYVPLDLLPGIVFSELAELGYQYFPLNTPNISLSSSNTERNISLGINPERSGFFIKDDVRIQFIRDTMVFNCVQDRYVGWDKYFHIILSVSQLFVGKRVVKSFNKVAIRYISVFENVDIFKNVNLKLNVPNLGFDLGDTVLRLNKHDGGAKIFVTLTNSAKKQDPKTAAEKQASIVDINIFHTFSSDVSDDEMMSVLDRIHSLEKETFFGLITAEFLDSLNPQY